jgi:hypothetical protein
MIQKGKTFFPSFIWYEYFALCIRKGDSPSYSSLSCPDVRL